MTSPAYFFAHKIFSRKRIKTAGRRVRSSRRVTIRFSFACSSALRSAISSGSGKLSGTRSFGLSKCSALSFCGEIVSDMVGKDNSKPLRETLETEFRSVSSSKLLRKLMLYGLQAHMPVCYISASERNPNLPQTTRGRLIVGYPRRPQPDVQ